jgi:hypothetical protein
MKVKELIRLLQKLPEDLEVIIPSPAEGREFSKMECVIKDLWYTPYRDNEYIGHIMTDQLRRENMVTERALECVLLEV